jgi:hypothetical protein
MKSMKAITMSLLVLIGGQVCAQIDLAEIQTPSSPAFTILGNQPNEISRPKSWSEIELSFYNNTVGEEGNIILPSNFAIEFSPYWMNHQNASFEEVTNPSIVQSLKQNLSISIGSNKVSQDTSATNLGLGIRTVFDFSSSSARLDSLEKLMNNSQDISTKFFAIIDEEILERNLSKIEVDAILKSQIKKFSNTEYVLDKGVAQLLRKYRKEVIEIPGNIFTDDELESLLNKISNFPELDLKELAKTLQVSAFENRYGFKVEVAGAAKIGYPSNEFGDEQFQKFGFWITPSFRHINIEKFEFLGVLRFIRNSQDLETDIKKYEELGFNTDYTLNTDIGGRVVFKNQRFSLSSEMIYRSQSIEFEKYEASGIRLNASSKESDFKWNVAASYRLSDQIILNYTYGKNFDLNTELPGNLISSITIGWALGTPILTEL